jgi:hypothetical protein
MWGRPEVCHARRVATARLDAAVWTDLWTMLRTPSILEEALRCAQQGWLSSDERAAGRHDLLPRQKEIQRQSERRIDAYAAEVLTLEELSKRRRTLEERLTELQRTEQQLTAEGVRGEQPQAMAANIERFRVKIAQGLEHADFATKRAIVELLVDRVVVDAPEVEIRYVVPLTGVAQRKGVLRLRHRAAPQRTQALQRRRRHLSQSFPIARRCYACAGRCSLSRTTSGSSPLNATGARPRCASSLSTSHRRTCRLT